MTAERFIPVSSYGTHLELLEQCLARSLIRMIHATNHT